jgi:hypothetical protein
VLALAGAAPQGNPACAGERELDFLRALAEREYHDLAGRYLDRLEARPQLSPELRDVLPYERAVVLLRAARDQRDLIRRQEQLEQARLQLERFIQAAPNHPRAADAGSEFGRILLERGRVALIQSQLPANRTRQNELEVQSRALLERARAALGQSLEQYEAQLRELTRQTGSASAEGSPAIDERGRVDRNVMQAKLDLALAQYELAHTYATKSNEFAEAIKAASGEFEGIHIEYRTQLVGLYGRMWQGRCFQELGEPTKALGLYRELLTGAGEDQQRETLVPLKRLRDNVLYFRLVSLNDPERRDYDAVVAEAEPWRRENARALVTEVGLGISIELARAYEALAQPKSDAGREQRQFLQMAAQIAGELARYDGQHQPMALAMAQRLGARTRKANPEGFDDLLDAARAALGDGFTAQRGDENGQGPEEARAHFSEALRLARSALENVRTDTAIEQVNEARLVMCHASYQLDRNYDAAVLGEFLARRYPDSGLAVNAAAVALAAFFREYQRAETRDRNADFAHLVDIAEWITSQWPDGPEAVRASMTVAGVYQQQGDPSEAATWYLTVPEGSERFAEAQQKAGMAFWDAYLRAAQLPRDQRGDREAFQEFRRQAQEHLERGLARMGEGESGETMSYTVAASKLSMAQVYVEGNRYDEALVLLEQIVRWVQRAGGPDPTADPRFVAEAYKAALRAYVGVRNLDAAEQIMSRLESLETTGDAGIVQVYQRLGQELENEVNRRRELDDRAGLDQMLAAFAAFLDRVSRREAGQTFETLAWTGDAYLRLAEGLDADGTAAADGERARELYAQAGDVFQRILDRGPQDAGAGASSLQGVRLRLARCLRRTGKFPDALKVASDVLRANARAVDAQIEAAYVYQDWAEAEGGHWSEAIAGGVPTEGGSQRSNLVWGWSTLGRLLQPSATPGSPYYVLWHEVRYNQAYCLYKKALEQSDRQERGRLLELAERDVRFTTRLSDDQGGPVWKGRLERLQRDIGQARAR